jgi:hypothetical protein
MMESQALSQEIVALVLGNYEFDGYYTIKLELSYLPGMSHLLCQGLWEHKKGVFLYWSTDRRAGQEIDQGFFLRC